MAEEGGGGAADGGGGCGGVEGGFEGAGAAVVLEEGEQGVEARDGERGVHLPLGVRAGLGARRWITIFVERGLGLGMPDAFLFVTSAHRGARAGLCAQGCLWGGA